MGDTTAKREWITRVLGVTFSDDAEPDMEEGGDPEPDTVLEDEDGYRRYLRTALKRLKTSETTNFGIALGAKGPEHRMLLNKRKGPRALGMAVVKQTGNHVHAFGIATLNPDRPTTMRLLLDSSQPPGLKKKGEKMLRAFAPLPFSRIALWVDGAEVEDLPDPSDDTAGNADDADALGAADLRLLLAQMPAMLTQQALALRGAAEEGAAFCEECPVDDDGVDVV